MNANEFNYLSKEQDQAPIDEQTIAIVQLIGQFSESEQDEIIGFLREYTSYPSSKMHAGLSLANELGGR